MSPSSIWLGGDARRCLWLAALSVLVACDARTTAPERNFVTQARTDVSTMAAATRSAVIQDALDRVFPALSDADRAAGLRVAVAAVLDALDRRDDAVASAAIERAEQLLDVYARSVGTESGDAADLDAIALALARARP